MLHWAELSPVLQRVERWVLPAECLLCQAPTDGDPEDPLVCRLCRSRWTPIPEPVCRICGQPLELDLECRVCEGWPDGLRMVRSAVWLTGSARTIVHQLKYGGWWRAASAMARVMMRLTPLSPDATLIPIPLGAARRRERGYNQCDFLATDLAREVGASVRTEVLLRRRDTKTQTGLTPEARRANTRGAFRSVRLTAELADRPLVLVDDVFTTGATILAGAEALRDAGAADVTGVTFARARRPLDDDLDALVHHDAL